MECTDGYTCDGTNQTVCPKGYYCKDGITTPCSAGTFKATSSANGTVFVLGGVGGSGGSGTHSGGWDGGEFFCGNTGSAGYSGVVIIKIPT